MKRTKGLMIIHFLIVCLMVFFMTMPALASKGVDAKNKQIKIAVVGPLTGQYGVYGQAQKEGVEYAIKKLNNQGGFKKGKFKGYGLEPTYFDDKGDPKESANIAQKIVIGDYFAEIGPTNSSPASASAPIFDRNNVAMILVYASDYRLTHSGYKNVFRMVSTTESEGYAYAAGAVTKLGHKKIAEIWENTAYGQTLHQYFGKKVKELNAELVASEAFVAGQDIDFKPILTKLKGLNPDLIMLNLTYNDGGLVVSQARNLGWDVPMLAATGCNAPKFVEMMPANPGDVYIAVIFSQLSDDPNVKNFLKGFEEMHKKGPSEASALSYDATLTLIQAIELGATKRENLKDYLMKVDYQGVTSRKKFDKNGDIVAPDFPVLKLGSDKKWFPFK